MPNNGPVLREMRRALGLPDVPMSWCGIFAGYIAMKASGLPDKTALRRALGFRSPFYVDSTQDWLAQAHDARMVVQLPEAGDLFVLLDKACKAHHIGFVASSVGLDGRFRTIEGNTNEGGSVNGDGVYWRTRSNGPGVAFIRLPKELKE